MPKVKRLTKILHPNSRKALDLVAKEHRKGRQLRSHQETKQKTNTLIKKLLWFKQAIDNSQSHSTNDDASMEQSDEAKEDNSNEQKIQNVKSFYSILEIHQLIEKYFLRFDEELEQIRLKKTIGKRQIGQHFSREKAIEMTLEMEKNEYETSGLVVPDLTSIEALQTFRNWNGETNLLPTIKLKTIKKISN